MPSDGDRDPCGRRYPHAKWGQPCGERLGRSKSAGTAPGGPTPAPGPTPTPAPDTREDDTARLDREHAERMGFLEEERRRETEFRERERSEEAARLEEQRRKEQEFLDRSKTEEQGRLDERRRQEQLFLDEGYAKEKEFLEKDFLRQKQYIEQSAALSEQERQLALQELETQFRLQQQQLELRREQIVENIEEEKRQAPLRLRDIADQFASQGSFFSGRRGEAQAQASHASSLVLKGFDRQLRSEDLTAEELQAMTDIKRGQFGIEAQKIALELETTLKELQAGLEKGLWSADFVYRQDSWQSDFSHRAGTQQNQLGYDMSSWESDFGFRTGTQTNQLGYDVGTWEGDFNYRAKAYDLKSVYEEGKRRLEEAVLDGLSGGEEGKVLSKTDLGTMLRQGIIDKKQYKMGLKSQGYSAEQAKALYMSEMAKGPLGAKGGSEGTKLSVSQLSTMLKQGLIDKGGYIKALKSKGYSAPEAKALYASEQAKVKSSGPGGKIISKTDIAEAVREGIMDPNAGYKNLRTLGYDDYSARVIIANAEKDLFDSNARKGSSGPKGKSLAKDDWISLYRNKMISEGELIAGLKSIDYTTEQAKALLANAKAARSRDSGGSSGAGGSRTLTGEEQVRVGTSVISPTRINESKPGTFLRKYWNEFNSDFEDVQAYVSQTTGTASLPSYISWWKKQYLAGDPRRTEKGAVATLQKYSKTISLAWYFYFYGGGMEAARRTSYIGA